MNITGTAKDAAKDFILRQKWSEKKKNGLVQNKKETETVPRIKQLREMAENEKKAQTMSAINNKMMSGKSLSKEELEYLREHNPKEYQKAVFLESERALYKEELKQCRTKEDVKKLKERHMMSFVQQSEAIDRSGLSRDDKTIAHRFLQMRVAACEDEFKTFRETADFKMLPAKRRKEDEDDPVPFVDGERILKELEAKLKQLDKPSVGADTAETVDAGSITEAVEAEASVKKTAEPASAETAPTGYNADGTVSVPDRTVSGKYTVINV